MIEVTLLEEDEVVRLEEGLEYIPEAVREGLQQAALLLRKMAQGRTPVLTGHAKRSWSDVHYESGGFSFGNPVDYTEILEHGLYPAPGPRTVAEGGLVYSRQAVGGILLPLLQDENLLERVVNLIVDEIRAGVENAGRT